MLQPAKFSIKLSDLNKRAIMEKVQQVYLQYVISITV